MPSSPRTHPAPGTPTYSTSQRYQRSGLKYRPADPLPPPHRRHLLEDRMKPDDKEWKPRTSSDAQPDAQHQGPHHQVPPPDVTPDTQLDDQPNGQPDVLPEAKSDADPKAKDLTIPLLLPTHPLPPRLPSRSMRSKPNSYHCLHQPPNKHGGGNYRTPPWTSFSQRVYAAHRYVS